MDEIEFEKHKFGNAAFGDEIIADAMPVDPDEYGKKHKIIFRNCTFDDLTITTTKKKFEFIDCIVSKALRLTPDISNISFSGSETILYHVDSYINITGGTIKKLELANHSFSKKFYLNKQDDVAKKRLTIEELSFKNVVFEKNFKLHYCDIKVFNGIVDTDFEKIADFLESTFNISDTPRDIVFERVNFRQLALFNNTKFGGELIFKYVTFEDQAQFLKSEFLNGIDLDSTTIKKEMNFFEAKGLENKASKQVTSQETYRIIKHNFKKLNNKIEANRFHALELEAKNNKLNWTFKELPEKTVYAIHQFSSDYGKNWIRPLFLILLVGSITALVLDFNKIINLFFNHTSGEGYQFLFWKYTYKFLLDAMKYSYILNKDFFKDTPIVFILNKAILSYLYYQFVSAVRKDTKG
jgi:hypothetical protein